MRTRRNVVAGFTSLALLSLLIVSPEAGASGSAPPQPSARSEYTVVVEDGMSPAAARAAVLAAGGTVLREDAAIGVLVVSAPAAGFVADVSASSAVLGATHAQPIGRTPTAGPAGVPNRDVSEFEAAGGGTAPATATDVSPSVAGLDPLDDQLWGLAMVRSDAARAVQAGDERVLVGILDSGVDRTHPDIAPNYSAALSRNFTTDIPTDPNGAVIDGPCEFAGCVDPPGWDDNGHGTHVAGTVAAAANGFGVSGVAPGVTIVSIRGGQDSGYVFLQPVLDALVYGADIGLDVINMSFYIDPWLYNCTANPADSLEDQLEQRATIAAVNRALAYAGRKKVTLVGSLGNNHEDLGKPRTDLSSPDYPAGAAYPRPIDNETCLDLPAEGTGVIGVSALGPSGVKADYSNYGVEQISLSAPGGYFRDFLGTPAHRTNANMILSTWPRNVALANGWINPDGTVSPLGVANALQRYCDAGTCAYYRHIQGTSMASPHVTGVAALVVSEYGARNHHGVTMNPKRVERQLLNSAAERACPDPPLFSYVDVGRPVEFDALCEGSLEFNGFYGYGIVDALAAVGGD